MKLIKDYFSKYTDSRHMIRSHLPYNIVLVAIVIGVALAVYPKYRDAKNWPKPFIFGVVQSIAFILLGLIYPMSAIHYTLFALILAIPSLLVPFTNGYC